MTNYDKLIASGREPSPELKRLYEYSQECLAMCKDGKKHMPPMPKMPKRKQCESAERTREYRKRIKQGE
jgi:hypothetical protein